MGPSAIAPNAPSTSSPSVVAVQKTTAVPSPAASPRGCLSPITGDPVRTQDKQTIQGQPESARPRIESVGTTLPSLSLRDNGRCDDAILRRSTLRLYRPSRRGVSFLRGIILRRHNASIVFQPRLTCLPRSAGGFPPSDHSIRFH